MKIALVSPYDYPYPGGVTNHISHLDEEFTRLGHAVTILAPSSLDEESLAARRVVKLGSVLPVPANGSEARITLSLRLSGKVKRLLDAERFDVIHLHEPLMPVLPITVLRHSQALRQPVASPFQPPAARPHRRCAARARLRRPALPG
jgi:phosphatidylinositol alpha-mannosyltransferase